MLIFLVPSGITSMEHEVNLASAIFSHHHQDISWLSFFVCKNSGTCKPSSHEPLFNLFIVGGSFTHKGS